MIDALSQAHEAWCARFGLTPAESLLVYVALEGTQTHRGLALYFAKTVHTVKKQTQCILVKSGAGSLRGVVIDILREALQIMNAARVAA